LVEKYYGKLTKDFHFNKKILSEVSIVPTKRLRNKIAGYATHLMKRIERGAIRGISLKLQEEVSLYSINFFQFTDRNSIKYFLLNSIITIYDDSRPCASLLRAK
jgi:ribosomal protein S17E